MKKGMIVVSAMVLFSMVGVGHAVETEYGELGIDVDVTWVSKYLFRGVDMLDDKAAFQTGITFDLFETGLSFGLWSSFAGASTPGHEDEEWRYTLTYANSVFDGEQYETDYAVSWVYYDFPDATSWDYDMQEFNLALSWPEICPAGMVPSYTIASLWPSFGGHENRAVSGFIHIFGLGYDYSVPGFLPDNPEQMLHLSAELVYNDGAGIGNRFARGGSVDHDWSHILWGVSTSVDLPYGSLTPAVYYQTSMEDSVNSEDELWVGISYGFSF